MDLGPDENVIKIGIKNAAYRTGPVLSAESLALIDPLRNTSLVIVEVGVVLKMKKGAFPDYNNKATLLQLGQVSM